MHQTEGTGIPGNRQMEFPKKQLLVVGDRVLITPRTATTGPGSGSTSRRRRIDSQQVQTGLIVATGPGTPVADLSSLDEEPWKVDAREGRSRGMQARVGDHAIFFRKAAVEISFEEKKYLVVPAGRDPRPDPRRPPDLSSVLPPSRREPAHAE